MLVKRACRAWPSASVAEITMRAPAPRGWASVPTSLLARWGSVSPPSSKALINSRMAAAITRSGRPVTLINCRFPDVVNGMIRAMGHEVACGLGNMAILFNVFGGSAAAPAGAEVKVLADYQNLAAWRRRPQERGGRPPRVWLGGREVADVYDRFADIQLTPEPVIEISGASGIPMLLAMAAGRSWQGHVPGPNGLPGGYPFKLNGGALKLDLPEGLTEAEAVAWNASFEEANGRVVRSDGQVSFTGILGERVAAHCPELRTSFAMRDLEAVCDLLLGLRSRLEKI